MKKFLIAIILISLLVGGVSAAITSSTSAVGSNYVVDYTGAGTTTWTAPAGVTSVRYLVVAGGGATNNQIASGGGGAGGYRTGDLAVTPGDSYTVTIGAGGTAGSNTRGTNGGNSVFSTITSTGGGAGGYFDDVGLRTGLAGGSGGGGIGYWGSGGGGASPSGQGNAGGTGSGGTAWGGGAGGGAGAVGAGGSGNNGGKGGDGLQSNITGSDVYYAGGGGGGAGGGGSGGAGGAGGGGGVNTAGTDGLGGGAGSGYKAGGIGRVILSYGMPPPVANFTANWTSGIFPLYEPQTIQFNDTSTNSPNAWNWSFTNVTGNNTETYFSTVKNATNTFGVGNYSISLNASNANGYNVSTQTWWVNVTPLTVVPVVNFSANKTTGAAPNTIQFTDTSYPPGDTVLWDFGDGRNSTERNPIKVYWVSGSYDVSLTTTNSIGTNSTTKSSYITVTSGVTRTRTYVENDTVDVYTGAGTAYWDTTSSLGTVSNVAYLILGGGGNGGPGGGSEYGGGGGGGGGQLITNTTDVSGLYTIVVGGVAQTSSFAGVTAVAGGVGGTPAYHVRGAPGATGGGTSDGGYGAYFIYSSNEYGYAGGPGTSNSITGSVVNYGYGGTGGNELKGVSYSGAPGEVGKVVIRYGPPLNALFSANATSGNFPLAILFTDVSNNGTASSWNWSFGDGTFSNSQNPVKTYSAAGTYTVVLNASNADSWDMETKTNYITVGTPAPVAAFSGNVISGYPAFNVTFTDSSTNIPTSWLWEFGDGQTSTTQNATNNYSAVIGNTITTYTINFSATNAGGTNWSNRSAYVTAYPLNASLSANATSGDFPLAILFTDLTNNGTASAWNWSFGDGTYSDSQSPTKTYSAAGTYTVVLNASNAYSWDMETKSGYITVSTEVYPLVANFTSNVTTGMVPVAVQFNDTSIENPTGWTWFFGDEFFVNNWTENNPHSDWSVRQGQTGVLLPNGSIVIMGGSWYGHGKLNDTWITPDNGVTWTEQTASASWEKRALHTSVVMSDGSIVLMGGSGSSGYLNDVWRSDDYGVTWTQQNTSPGWSARYCHGSVVMPDDTIILMGGSGSGTHGGFKGDIWKSTDMGATWLLVNESAEWGERNCEASVVMPDGSIILMGGEGYNGYMNDVWRSEDDGDTWTQQTDNAGWTPRGMHSSVVLPDGSIILIGGLDEDGVRQNDVWRSTDYGVTWTELSPESDWSGRYSQNNVVTADGGVIMMGGMDNSGNQKNDVWYTQYSENRDENPVYIFTIPGCYPVSLRSYNSVGYDSEIKTDYICVEEFVPTPTPTPSPTPVPPLEGPDIWWAAFFSALGCLLLLVLYELLRWATTPEGGESRLRKIDP